LIGPGGITPDQALFWQNAIEKMTNTAQWKSYISSNSLRPMTLFGPPALDYIAQENERLVEVLKELGVAQP
jgi:tripartite-type tricarboxylate transporter receptor subunit TctC